MCQYVTHRRRTLFGDLFVGNTPHCRSSHHGAPSKTRRQGAGDGAHHWRGWANCVQVRSLPRCPRRMPRPQTSPFYSRLSPTHPTPPPVRAAWSSWWRAATCWGRTSPWCCTCWTLRLWRLSWRCVRAAYEEVGVPTVSRGLPRHPVGRVKRAEVATGADGLRICLR
jgi:hypothetical protein